MPQRASTPTSTPLSAPASTPGAPSLVLEPAPEPAPPAPVLRLEPTPAAGTAPATQPAPDAPISVGPAGDVELETPIITTGLGVWIVRPGDSLWSIAEAVLQERSGTPADLEAVEPYWHRLIAANREHLADPANPDLLFTGQQLTLPPR